MKIFKLQKDPGRNLNLKQLFKHVDSFATPGKKKYSKLQIYT